ncbi:MAG: ankyrin repeat domain-containing protein [Candidatus Wallbacteria bacterium]
MFGKNIVRSIVVLMLLFLTINSDIYAKNNSAEKERIKLKENKVKTVTEFLYFPQTKNQKKKSFKEYNGEGARKVLIEFDDQEKQLKKTEYAISNNLETGYAEYDANNNIRLKCESHYNNSKSIITDENFYDKNDILAYKRVCSYDSDENLVEQVMYDKNNKLVSKASFKYDSKGNKIESSNFDAESKLTGRVEYKYDDKDNLTEQIFFDKGNIKTGRRMYSYTNSLLNEMVGYNASDKQNMCCRYKYEFYQESPVAVSKVDFTKSIELKRTSEVKIVNVGSTNEVRVSTVNTEENELPDFMSTLSESEVRDILFLRHVESMKELNYDQVKKIFEDNKLEVNAQNSSGISYLMMAVAYGNKDMVKYLLDNGANLELKDNKNNGIKAYLRSAWTKSSEVSEMINSALKK